MNTQTHKAARSAGQQRRFWLWEAFNPHFGKNLRSGSAWEWVPWGGEKDPVVLPFLTPHHPHFLSPLFSTGLWPCSHCTQVTSVSPGSHL